MAENAAIFKNSFDLFSLASTRNAFQCLALWHGNILVSCIYNSFHLTPFCVSSIQVRAVCFINMWCVIFSSLHLIHSSHNMWYTPHLSVNYWTMIWSIFNLIFINQFSANWDRKFCPGSHFSMNIMTRSWFDNAHCCLWAVSNLDITNIYIYIFILTDTQKLPLDASIRIA